MVKEILIDKYGVGHAVAIMEDGKLKDLYIDPLNFNSFYPPHSILIAKISRKVREKGGYFVILPNKKQGFLLSKTAYALGDNVAVMANPFYEKGKSQRFSDRLKIETKYLIIQQGKGRIKFSKGIERGKLRSFPENKIKEKIVQFNEKVSVILRSSLNNNVELDWDKVLNFSFQMYKEIVKKLECKENNQFLMLSKEKANCIFGLDNSYKTIERDGIFELQGIWDKIEKFKEKKVIFGKSSYLIIEQTSSFCSIDVNTGNDFKINAHRVNLDACDFIVNNIYLRAIGGKVIIDFLPCSKEEKKEVLSKLTLGLKSGGGRFTVFGWTKGNNFEVEAVRHKVPLNLLMKS